MQKELIEEMRQLRRDGLSIRDIAKETGVPRATVHRYVRDEERSEINIQEIIKGVGRLVKDLNGDGWIVATYWTYFCPACGKEQSHFFVCSCCGIFIGAECKGDNKDCAIGWDLKNMKKGRPVPEHR